MKTVQQDVEQFCQVHCSQTYNSTEMDKKTPTYGGYSTQIVVKEDYALKISDAENLAGNRAASLRRNHDLFAAQKI